MEMEGTVVVASRNPVKLEATRRAFSSMLGDGFTFEGISVPSGVDDQPRTDDETRLGATNRVRNAADAHPDAAFWVGLEGGIEGGIGDPVGNDGATMYAFAWAVVGQRDDDGELRLGSSRSATFALPDAVAVLVRGGKELGEADDIVFGQTNSKHQGGAVGLLTGGVIDRTALYAPAVILALIPFR